MVQLTPEESRVLGVLVEKAMTTPAQYPMTLNALVSGCNQKSNRDPVVNFTEDTALAAIDGLKQKELAREVMMTGSRVPKYRHTSRETLDVGTAELVVLAELMLRGPQTVGEIRNRASRMHPLESLEIVKNVLEHLQQRDPALIKRIAPAPGSRAERFVQLLSPDRRATEAPAAVPAETNSSSDDLNLRIERLEEQVRDLQQELNRLISSSSSSSSSTSE